MIFCFVLFLVLDTGSYSPGGPRTREAGTATPILCTRAFSYKACTEIPPSWQLNACLREAIRREGELRVSQASIVSEKVALLHPSISHQSLKMSTNGSFLSFFLKCVCVCACTHAQVPMKARGGHWLNPKKLAMPMGAKNRSWDLWKSSMYS